MAGRSGLEYKKFTTLPDGSVAVRTTAQLEVGDIEIGAVEIKDATSNNRQIINSDGEAYIKENSKNKVLAQENLNTITLTTSYQDLSGEISVEGNDTVGVFIDANVNDSENVTMKLYALYEHGGDEYEIDILGEESLWTTGASDFKKYYEIKTGMFKYLKIKVKADTVGTTAGIVSGVITKGFKN